MNILTNILNNKDMLMLYGLCEVITRCAAIVFPFVLAYILSKKIKRLFSKILLFTGSAGAFLFIMYLYTLRYTHRFEIHNDKYTFDINLSILLSFFFYYGIGLLFCLKFKKNYFKVLSVAGFTLIFILWIIFYLEGKHRLSTFVGCYSDRIVCVAATEYSRTHNGYYPVQGDWVEIYGGKFKFKLGKDLICPNTHIPYEWTQKRYRTTDNPNFMLTWDGKPHGFIFKWRYVNFIGGYKAVPEGEFQKLLKEQQD
ncbi:MAG: hypothetical protein AB1630_08420 [bacterium]